MSRHQTGVSVTCGIAETADPEDSDRLIRKADLALYEAKRSGRRVVVYSDSLAPKPPEASAQRATRHQERLLATALARAVEAKDPGTRNHCETVSELCARMAFTLGLDDARIERVRLAGLLHDVGKIGVPDRILRSPSASRGTRPPREQPRPHRSCDRCRRELEEEARWVLHHHEQPDGAGYPLGLRAMRSRSSRGSYSSPTRSRR